MPDVDEVLEDEENGAPTAPSPRFVVVDICMGSPLIIDTRHPDVAADDDETPIIIVDGSGLCSALAEFVVADFGVSSSLSNGTRLGLMDLRDCFCCGGVCVLDRDGWSLDTSERGFLLRVVRVSDVGCSSCDAGCVSVGVCSSASLCLLVC